MFKKYTVVSPLHTVRRFSSSEAAHVSLDILPESQCKTQHLRLDFLNFFFCFLYVCTYIYDKRTVLSLTPPHFVTYGPFGTHGRQNTSVHVRACPDLPSLPLLFFLLLLPKCTDSITSPGLLLRNSISPFQGPETQREETF